MLAEEARSPSPSRSRNARGPRGRVEVTPGRGGGAAPAGLRARDPEPGPRTRAPPGAGGGETLSRGVREPGARLPQAAQAPARPRRKGPAPPFGARAQGPARPAPAAEPGPVAWPGLLAPHGAWGGWWRRLPLPPPSLRAAPGSGSLGARYLGPGRSACVLYRPRNLRGLPLPGPQFPACTMGINDTYLLPGPL